MADRNVRVGDGSDEIWHEHVNLPQLLKGKSVLVISRMDVGEVLCNYVVDLGGQCSVVEDVSEARTLLVETGSIDALVLCMYSVAQEAVAELIDEVLKPNNVPYVLVISSDQDLECLRPTHLEGITRIDVFSCSPRGIETALASLA